jgi:serine/threonine protein kinase
VVRVYDTGVFQGYPYLAMELVEGLTLRHYLELAEEDLASDAALSRAIIAHREGPRAAAAERDDESEDDEVDDDAQSGVFGLAGLDDEPPSEEFSGSASDEYEEGPDRVRAWADLADEPDTNSSYSEEGRVPDELPEAEPRITRARLTEFELDRLNSAERIGRLKDAMLQLCEALSYIHGYGLIHRDLKPSNVMVDEDRTVRLMDFGLAKYISDDAAVTADGRLVGTFRYMAPEQILGEKLDTRTDLYSLGIILYELLAGRPPFEARTPYELWQQVLETEPTPIAAINARSDRVLSRVAHRLIRKEPDDRFQTAEEVYEALIE